MTRYHQEPGTTSSVPSSLERPATALLDASVTHHARERPPKRELALKARSGPLTHVLRATRMLPSPRKRPARWPVFRRVLTPCHHLDERLRARRENQCQRARAHPHQSSLHSPRAPRDEVAARGRTAPQRVLCHHATTKKPAAPGRSHFLQSTCRARGAAWVPPLTAASELRTIKRAGESEAGASTAARATRVVVRTGRSPPLVALAAIFALVHTLAAWVFRSLGVSQLGWRFRSLGGFVGSYCETPSQ